MLCVSFLCSLIAVSQSAVKGKISMSSDNSSIPGATVLIKGTSKGTSTDINGDYYLTLTEQADTLQISFVGFITVEVAIAGRAVVDVSMVENTEQLSEFVVTALGISKEKKALGYAVAEVDVSKMTKARDANVVNTISGKVAGVQVSKTSGGPGTSSRIVIRGNKSISKSNF